MSAGLDASTVTPGITAPDASWTTPTMLARSWAEAARATIRETQATPTAKAIRRMSCPPAGDKETVTALILGLRSRDVNNFRNPLWNLDIPADCGQYERLREVCFQCEKR